MNNHAVYFSRLATSPNMGFSEIIHKLLDKVNIDKKIEKGDYVAIKTHFGERGNATFIRPIFHKFIIDKCRSYSERIFLTDTNTLYMVGRGEGISHLDTAYQHGFSLANMGVPVIIADGLISNNYKSVEVQLKHFKEIDVAQEIYNANSMIVISHIKFHNLLGFGGALKQLGMGCVAKQAKMKMHSGLMPLVNKGKCILCKKCISWCKYNAIELNDKKEIYINDKKCTGCSICLTICPAQALFINWKVDLDQLQEKIVEHAYGVVKDKKGKVIFINFLHDIYADCDCVANVGCKIVEDIGIMTSDDPVAIDKASIDLINGKTGLESEYLKNIHSKDKVREIYPGINWEIQLNYAESIGLGNKKYNLIDL